MNGAQPQATPESVSLRRPSGLATDGEALYLCEGCGQNKRRSLFATHEDGRVRLLCQDCDRKKLDVPAPRPHKRHDRSHVTVTEKVCGLCEERKPASAFWLDNKTQDNLSRLCVRCQQLRVEQRKEKKLPVFESWESAATLQPVLDQAIKERDELAAEVKRLSTLAGQPRENDVLREVQSLRDRIDQLSQQTSTHAKEQHRLKAVVSEGRLFVANLIGPFAYGVFRWAEGIVVSEDDE